MYCENCGNEYSPEENFCIKCGNALEEAGSNNAPVSVSEMPDFNKKQDERWYHRFGIVVYVLAHLPLLIVVPIVWSENAREYSTYYKSYRGSDSEAFWYCFLTIIIWIGVLRLIKIATRYIIGGTKPKFKDLLYF
jgi:hypothetical protein